MKGKAICNEKTKYIYWHINSNCCGTICDCFGKVYHTKGLAVYRWKEYLFWNDEKSSHKNKRKSYGKQ